MMDPTRDDDQLEETDAERRGTEVVPAVSSEQPPISAPIGRNGYADWAANVTGDNDQERHVTPSDNDGETIPQDDVVDQAGG